MKYNDSQLLAVSHGSGPMLVLAGPGSGKTTVIINRIHRMVSVLGIPATNILAVTFSRAASTEMADRYAKISPDGSAPTFGTFHSIFLNILRADKPEIPFKLITEKQKYLFIRSIIEHQNLVYENINDYMNAFLASISRFKESGMDKNRSPLCLFVTDNQFLQVFDSYDSMLKTNGLIDFDDIILKCLKHLSEDKKALRNWQNRYQYILVDEFQDISPMQYEIIRLLEGNEHNLFVVGDDDQSIYGFRGASPESLKQFTHDHPDARSVLLNINYRCSPAIINSALKVISRNNDRFDKNILPAGDTNTGNVSFFAFEKRYEEYLNIINYIQRYHLDGNYDIAVLFRNNSDSHLFTKLLSDYNIPFESSCPGSELTDHFTIKDMLSYMQLSQNLKKGSNKESLDLICAILNKPSRYISKDSLLGLNNYGAQNCFKRMYSEYINNSFVLKKIREFEQQLMLISGLSPKASVKYIRNVIGYDKWLADFAKEHNKDFEEYSIHLDNFEEYLEAFASSDELLNRINDEALHDYSSLKQIQNNDISLPPVKIMTMHSSKGMEFDTVFLPDSNDSIIPNKRALKDGSENEERRLYYVAMTRAKSNLHISYVRQLHNKTAYPTRFLKELIDSKYK